jgi:hypothetical protein
MPFPCNGHHLLVIIRCSFLLPTLKLHVCTFCFEHIDYKRLTNGSTWSLPSRHFHMQDINSTSRFFISWHGKSQRKDEQTSKYRARSVSVSLPGQTKLPFHFCTGCRFLSPTLTIHSPGWRPKVTPPVSWYWCRSSSTLAKVTNTLCKFYMAFYLVLHTVVTMASINP